jgi:hypothetical protein
VENVRIISMKTFSQRKGCKPASEIIQTDGMTDELRNSLWNALDVTIWSVDGYVTKQYGTAEIKPFSKSLWFHYFKKPIDSRETYGIHILKAIRKYFFECPWYEVYDFIEFVSKYHRYNKELQTLINLILERELSGYRLIDGVIADITDKQEVQMLEEALRDTKFESVSNHLRRALELLSDKKKPDYRNSIKESISAVESMARIITGTPKANLGDALRILEKTGKLHAALKAGFSNLYGYTSDEGGIRHAMLGEPNIDVNDAKFFLLSCTSFVNYLKSKI